MMMMFIKAVPVLLSVLNNKAMGIMNIEIVIAMPSTLFMKYYLNKYLGIVIGASKNAIRLTLHPSNFSIAADA